MKNLIASAVVIGASMISFTASADRQCDIDKVRVIEGSRLHVQIDARKCRSDNYKLFFEVKDNRSGKLVGRKIIKDPHINDYQFLMGTKTVSRNKYTLYMYKGGLSSQWIAVDDLAFRAP